MVVPQEGKSLIVLLIIYENNLLNISYLSLAILYSSTIIIKLITLALVNVPY